MTKLNIVILLSISISLSSNVFSLEDILFDNSNYNLSNRIERFCNTLFLYNKEIKKEMLLNDPLINMVDFSKPICFFKNNKESIKIHLYPSGVDEISGDGHYLRINYDLETNVYAANRYQKVDYSRCAVIDLKTATLIYETGARDEVCAEDNYLAYVFPNIGLPIQLSSLISYIKKHDPVNIQENEVDKYTDILISYGISIDERNELSNMLKQHGLSSQAEKVSKQKNLIKRKSILYIQPNQETKMYLIKGDKVTILDEQTDDTNQKWYFIKYKGKKDINMWIKAEAVDVTE